MADYSFSSAGMRKKKPKIKLKKTSLDGGEGAIVQPAHKSPAHAQASSSEAPRPRSDDGVEETKEHVSPPSGRSTSSGGNNVKKYIKSLNNSAWPPPVVSSSDDSSEGTNQPLKPPEKTGTIKPTPSKVDTKQTLQNDASRSHSKETPNNQLWFDDDDSDDGSAHSDDSDVLSSKKTIDKYRHKYLEEGNTSAAKVKNDSGAKTALSSPESRDKDDGDSDNGNDKTYDKYRKRLSENKGSGKKEWSASKRKLGAPPSLEYNYRYASAPPPPAVKKKKPTAPTPDTKPKMEKVKLKSKKIAKEDLGILESMLGGGDSDSESNGSHGIFSESSEDGTLFLDFQSSDDDEETATIETDQQGKGGRSGNSGTSVDDNNASQESSILEEEIKVVDDYMVDAITEEVIGKHNEELLHKKNNHDDLSDDESQNTEKKHLSIRMAALQHQRKERSSQRSSRTADKAATAQKKSEGSASSTASSKKKGMKSTTVTAASAPPIIRENEEEENLGTYLDSQPNGVEPHLREAPPKKSDIDDFSGIWAQSVSAESAAQAVPYRGDDSVSTTEASKARQESQICYPVTSSRADDKSYTAVLTTSNDESSRQISPRSMEFEESESTMEAPNSLSQDRSLPGVDSSMQFDEESYTDVSAYRDESVAPVLPQSLKSGESQSAMGASNSMSNSNSRPAVDTSMWSENSEEPNDIDRQAPSPPSEAKHLNTMLVQKESSGSSGSDGSLDFDQVTELEQYTMNDSKSTSKDLSDEKLSSSKKIIRKEKPDQNIKKEKTNDESMELAAIERKEKPDKSIKKENMNDESMELAVIESKQKTDKNIKNERTKVDTSMQSNDSDRQAPSPPSEAKHLNIMFVQKESSGSSGSDGSLDFDQVTELEQYTMNDSKSTSKDLSDEKLSSSKKIIRKEKPDQNIKKEKTNDESMELAAIERKEKPDKSIKKENMNDESLELAAIGSKDSDRSLDSLDLGSKPVESLKKKPSGKAAMLEDDESMSDFSLAASKDLTDDESISAFNRPEYEPQRSNRKLNKSESSMELNQGFQALNTSDLIDMEAAEAGSMRSKTSSNSPSKPPSKKKKTNIQGKTIFSTGLPKHLGRAWAGLAVLSAIGLPIYFFAFRDSNEPITPPPPLRLFPTPPTFPPSIAHVELPSLPTPPPVDQPALRPTLPPVTASPTIASTSSRIESLRTFLISVWPPLKEDFVGLNTPQYRALDWLANNENFESYTEDRLIQRFVLASFYYSTSGNNWRRSDLWLSAEDECQWYPGRTSEPLCNADGAYTHFDLDLNNLAGTLPSEMALLSNSLVRLDISRAGSPGALSSTIPPEFGLLNLLEAVNLAGNELFGSIPSTIGNWTSVESLDLNNNLFFGGLPTEIGNMNDLTLLNVQRNQLDGPLPSTIGVLTKIKTLNLANNRLAGPIPSELGAVFLLDTINLEGNQFTSIPSEIGRLIFLRQLSVSNNALEGSVPSELGNLVNLLSLRLESNTLTGTLPPSLGNLIELRDILNMSNNQLSGPLPAEFGSLILLRNMLLYNNQLIGPIPDSFANLNRLGVLRLEANNLTGVVPDAVCEVYNTTFPVFATDCSPEPEIECPCCMFCCQDDGDCTCQFENTDLAFLCVEFETSTGLSGRIGN